MNRMVKTFMCFVMTVCVFVSFGCDEIDPNLVLASIKTVSEYGTYFGMKAAKFDEQKAKIAEEGVRAIVLFLENDSLIQMVEIESLTSKLDDDIIAIINPLLLKIDGKYVDIKNKIPADKIPYIKAVFSGSFKGIENYRKFIESSSELKIASVMEYEKDLYEKNKKAEQIINN